MKDEFQLERRLSSRMLRWVLSAAVIGGMLLSITQIILDARRVSADVDRHGVETIELVRDAATQAIFSLDDDLAKQVVAGLFGQDELQSAAIRHPGGDLLAGHQRPLRESPWRTITNWIFGETRNYSVDLQHDGLTLAGKPMVYGELELVYDTAPAARAWVERSALTFVVGILRATIVGLILFLVMYRLMTRPLQRVVSALLQVDPVHPDRRLLQRPRGHQRDELDILVKAINKLLISIAESRRKHQDAENRVNRLSRYDQLTGLPSRETILAALTSSIEESQRSLDKLAVYCCGIDDFKSINEQRGYQTGDLMLRVLAERLNTKTRLHHSLAGRLSGDQFVVIAHSVEDQYEAAKLAESLLELFREPISLDGDIQRVTATIGVALYPNDATEAGQLLQHAEQTMTLAKAGASNHSRFYVASIDQEIRARRQLEKDLAQAIPRGEFHLVYQPQVSFQSNRIIGAEALLRWTHPERGNIPPDQFIPIAEQSGSIVEIGEWVLDEACRQAAIWAAQGSPLRIAVNLSAIQLRQPDIVGTVLDTLGRHQIPPGRLELEVTETGFMENLEDAVQKLCQLKSAGISIAVDDFGTGYSSLTYLKRMPIQHIKIDRQFIQDLLTNEDGTRIANTIIDLGRSLNLSVIAEGVETQEQEFYLRQRGCQIGQGYYFSRPLTPDAFEEFVVQFHGRLEENVDNPQYNR